ncbi:MAG: hypothetical protein JZU53_01485 [Paludibacter sp.]|nr:hypothetical protein [Paludibacter sp.]
MKSFSKVFANLMLFVAISGGVNAQSDGAVGIGVRTPNASAMLDVRSTNKGVLLPQVKLTAIDDITTVPNPADGLIVYNVDGSAITAGYYYFKGTQWHLLMAGNTSLSGDVLGSLGNTTVDKLKGAALIISSLSTNDILKFNGTNWVNAQPSIKLNNLLAASATNTIDNINNAQTWNWNSATTQDALTIAAPALTTGSALTITGGNALTSGSLLKLSSTGAGSGGLLSVVNNASSSGKVVATIQANSTAGSGLTVLANGNVGIGTATPAATLHNNGTTIFKAKAIANFPDFNTSISQTDVDDNTFLLITQTSPNVWIRIPSPSSGSSVAGKMLYIVNNGTAPLTVDNVVLGVNGDPGSSSCQRIALFIWTGTKWAIPVSPDFSNLTGAQFANTINNGDKAQTWNWDSATTQDALTINAKALTTGTALKIASTSTSATATSALLNLSASGTMGASGTTTTAAVISNTRTNAAGGTNIGLSLTASGATTANTALAITAGDFDQSGATTGTFKTGGGAVSLNGDVTLAKGKKLTLSGSTSGTVIFATTSSPTAYTLTLPGAAPTQNGQILSSDNSGNLSWVTNSATTATSNNTVGTIVARDGTGNFSAGTITASLSGNASTSTKLASSRSIYGGSFDGSADLTSVIASAYGGTGNGFTEFSGPVSTKKTFTLPNANATILTTYAAVTVPQGGTGLGAITANHLMYGAGTNSVSLLSPHVTTGAILMSTANAAPSWSLLSGLPASAGILPVANGGTGSNSQNWVDLSADQTAIAGKKTFTAFGTFSAGLTASGATVSINDNSSTNATNINTGTSTGAVNIATGTTGGNVITIGNAAGTTGIVEKVGTGNYTLDGVAGSNYTIGASTVNGKIDIGGTDQKGTITLGNSSAAQTVNVGTGAGVSTVNIANGTAGNTVNIANGANNSPQTINIGAGACVESNTINIGTGQAVSGGFSAITIGSNARDANVTVIKGGGNLTSTGIKIIPNLAGQIQIGADDGKGDIIIGSSTNSQMVRIGGGGGASTVEIGNCGGASTVNIGNSTNTNEQTINIGAGASSANKIIKIGSGTNTAGKSAVEIGSYTDLYNETKIMGGKGVSAIKIIPHRTGNITIGSENGIGDIAIGVSDASQKILIGTGSSGSKVTIGGANSVVDLYSKVGIGVTPTASLQLPTSTGAVGTAPLKLTAGTKLTTTEAGVIEYDGTHLYFTATAGGTRYQLDQQGTSITNVSTSAYPLLTSDESIFVSVTSTITLPNPTTCTGKKYAVKNVGSGTVTVKVNGGANIDDANGSTGISGSLKNQGWIFQSSGTVWYIIARI